VYSGVSVGTAGFSVEPAAEDVDIVMFLRDIVMSECKVGWIVTTPTLTSAEKLVELEVEEVEDGVPSVKDVNCRVVTEPPAIEIVSGFVNKAGQFCEFVFVRITCAPAEFLSKKNTYLVAGMGPRYPFFISIRASPAIVMEDEASTE
jgi:hypothetical protein